MLPAPVLAASFSGRGLGYRYNARLFGQGGILRVFGLVWGLGGVVALLLFAIYRLAPLAGELVNLQLNLLHWAALIFSVIYMSYAEGYKGFHLGFAPRVIVRAQYLWRHPRPAFVLLAPLLCMGFIHATRRRKIASVALTTMIICFIAVARQLPQPWRGILDAGVVAGLSIGIISILYFMAVAWWSPQRIDVSADTPEPARP